MRVVFFGTPAFAVPSLAAVAGAHTVTAVVCQPDKPQGRSAQLVPPPTKVWAEQHGIAVVQPTKLNDGAFEAWLREQQPDVCVLVAYGRILKQPLLDVPSHGFINAHASLLPRHRGASPIQTSILVGDEVTGVSIMRLDAGMDTGDVLLKEETPLLPDDTTTSLSERLAGISAPALLRALELIGSGQAVFTAQDPAQATECRMFKKEDGQIRWAASAHDIHNLVRASIPWPVAHCLYKGGVCRIIKTEVIAKTGESTQPGTVVEVTKDRVVVATGEGCLAIIEIQMPGKRAMAVADFLRGQSMRPGDRFEDL